RGLLGRTYVPAQSPAAASSVVSGACTVMRTCRAALGDYVKPGQSRPSCRSTAELRWLERHGRERAAGVKHRLLIAVAAKNVLGCGVDTGNQPRKDQTHKPV